MPLLRHRLAIASFSLLLVALVVAVGERPATGQPTPAAGGVYVEGVVGHPTYLNPVLASFNDADNDVASLVFSGLTRHAPDGTLAPDLATSWAVSPDGKTYTFQLRDASWQDGQPVTAGDVVFTVGLIQSPNYPGSPDVARLWQGIKAAAVDDHTVRFTLSAPDAPFLDQTTLGIVPEHLLRGTAGQALLTSPFNAHPVGSGPFQVKDASLQQVALVPSPRYYGKAPYLAGLTFRYYDTMDAAVDGLSRGEVQGLGNLPAANVLDQASDSRVNLLQAPDYASLVLLVLNDQAPLFADADVRRALDLAIDRGALIQAANGGEGVPAVGPIFPTSWAYAAQGGAYTYDPSQAAQLLDQAGWKADPTSGLRAKSGQPLRFVLLAASQPERLRVAQEISRQLRAVGVEADVQTAAWTSIVQDFLAPRRFDAILTETYSPSADPDPYPFWDSSQIKGGLNAAGWRDPTADQLLEDARRQTGQDARRADYAKFQQLFAQQQPSILLYYPTYVYALPSALNGASLGLILQPADRFATVGNWYLRTNPSSGP